MVARPKEVIYCGIPCQTVNGVKNTRVHRYPLYADVELRSHEVGDFPYEGNTAGPVERGPDELLRSSTAVVGRVGAGELCMFGSV